MIERHINISDLQLGPDGLPIGMTFDLNNNTVPDAVERTIDSNLDGLFDTSVNTHNSWLSSIDILKDSDLDLNGFPDLMEMDMNNNNILDSMEDAFDVSGDGIPDIIVNELIDIPEMSEIASNSADLLDWL